MVRADEVVQGEVRANKSFNGGVSCSHWGDSRKPPLHQNTLQAFRKVCYLMKWKWAVSEKAAICAAFQQKLWAESICHHLRRRAEVTPPPWRKANHHDCQGCDGTFNGNHMKSCTPTNMNPTTEVLEDDALFPNGTFQEKNQKPPSWTTRMSKPEWCQWRSYKWHPPSSHHFLIAWGNLASASDMSPSPVPTPFFFERSCNIHPRTSLCGFTPLKTNMSPKRNFFLVGNRSEPTIEFSGDIR